MPDYRIQPMPAQLSPALVAKLAKVETATVGHSQHWGFMDRGIQPLLPRKPRRGHRRLPSPSRARIRPCCITRSACCVPATSWSSTGSATTSTPAGAAALRWRPRPPARPPESSTVRAPT